MDTVALFWFRHLSSILCFELKKKLKNHRICWVGRLENFLVIPLKICFLIIQFITGNRMLLQAASSWFLIDKKSSLSLSCGRYTHHQREQFSVNIFPSLQWVCLAVIEAFMAFIFLSLYLFSASMQIPFQDKNIRVSTEWEQVPKGKASQRRLILKQYHVQSCILALFQSEKNPAGRTVFSVDKRQCHTSFLD